MNARESVRSYADAFYEAALEHWLSTLDHVGDRLADDRTLLARLEASDVDFGQRQALLHQVLPVDTDPLVRNLLYTLMQHGDLGLVPEIAAALKQRTERGQAAPIQVTVTSAVALTDAERSRLAAKLEAQFGAGLDMQYQIDPAILGGMIVRVGDKLIDGSLATRLAAMRQTLGLAGEK